MTQVSETQGALERLRGIETRARGLLEPLTPSQLNWRPSPGRWSIGECTEHVNRTNRGYVEAMVPAIAGARSRGLLAAGPFRYGRLERWFAAQVEPPVRRRLPAPRRFRPRSGGTPDGTASAVDPAAVKEYFSLLGDLGVQVSAASGVDLAAVKIASPISALLRFRLGAAFQIVLGHTDRHLQQAERVRENAEFPTEAK